MTRGVWGAVADEADIETMARLAGPDAEATLAQLQAKAASSRCGMPETLRRFRMACLDGTFSKTARPDRRRKVRSADEPEARDPELERELEKVRRLGVRVILAGLEAQFAGVAVGSLAAHLRSHLAR